MSCALITGVAGQDGSYLAELLLEKNYEVHGLVRQNTSLERLDSIQESTSDFKSRFFLHNVDLDDSAALHASMARASPSEIYHLAAQSHVGLSFKQIESTCESVAFGTLRLLEAALALPKPPRIFHASSSEIFGKPETVPQDETTRMNPVNPYGAAKVFATQMVSIYREKFGLFACNGILYNHESPRRGLDFVTRKICRAAARIQSGEQKELLIGDISARRDWGHARDYVRGMWLALQHETAEDFVFATGQTHSVEDVLKIAFEEAGLNWQKYVQIHQTLLRAEEPRQLIGNAAKAQRLLGWRPEISFEQLIVEMVQFEMRALRRKNVAD